MPSPTEAEERPPQVARVIWQVRFDSEIGRRPLAVGDGVLVPLTRRGDVVVRRISVDAGETEWETVLDGPAAAAICRTGQVVVVPLTSGRLASLQLSNGEPTDVVWRRIMGEFADPVLAHGGRVFVRIMPGSGARLAAFEVGRPAQLWSIADPARGATNTHLVSGGELLVVLADNGRGKLAMIGLGPADGRVQWRNEDLEGHVNDVYNIAGVFDVLTDVHGVTRVDLGTGQLRNRRLSNFPFERAFAVGEHVVMITKVKDARALFCFSSVGEKVIGRLRNHPIVSIIGAHPTEVLAQQEDGLPALYDLPDLGPIELPEAPAIGPTRDVVWSRDVAYLVGGDRRTLTAVDLDYRA